VSAGVNVTPLSRGSPITAEWLNTLARATLAITPAAPAENVSAPAATAQSPPGAASEVWTVVAVETTEEEVSNAEETCTVTVTRITGFTVSRPDGSTVTISGFGAF
jgi:hypothetical protein